jgi:hypothetical protein
MGDLVAAVLDILDLPRVRDEIDIVLADHSNKQVRCLLYLAGYFRKQVKILVFAW